MSTIKAVPDLSNRVSLIRKKIIDVSSRVSDITEGIILASDASPYEAIAKKDFPSIRVGLLKFSNVIIRVADYRLLRDRNDIFVDPVEIAKLKRSANSMNVALPGAGITSDEVPLSKNLFRRKVFDIFMAEQFKSGNERLYDTLIDLLRRSNSIKSDSDGRECVLLHKEKKPPIDGLKLTEHIYIPLDPGFVDIDGDVQKRVYVTDAIRVHEVFVNEGSNAECFGRLMSALEHILLAHLIRCAHSVDPTSTGYLHVIVDGPLAIFGEAARFHRSIMSLLHDVRMDCQRIGMPGPLVVGVSKTGKIVEHARQIERLLQFDENDDARNGTYLLTVDDKYRYELIQASESNLAGNFGKDEYYGQTFIVRTSKGKIFDVTLAYPFERKADVDGEEFRDAKVNLRHYEGHLDRMLSLIEMMQTDLFQNALIPVHLAHRYASIAHSPAGRSLDAFVREALGIKK
ncbi:hypothetical protein [Rhodopseudomonas palustris]|uniref:hypothetical protein n=1 Tax=Rhodopseudomonas palustris TaxID=1076 RepID=UPI0012D42132|nr:hypothetical protein [Rhodopseudomonas palustris]